MVQMQHTYVQFLNKENGQITRDRSLLLLTALDQELSKTLELNKKYVEARLPEITDKAIKESKDFFNLELI